MVDHQNTRTQAKFASTLKSTAPCVSTNSPLAKSSHLAKANTDGVGLKVSSDYRGKEQNGAFAEAQSKLYHVGQEESGSSSS